MGVEYECCESGFFIHIAVIFFLVLFAGMMSGLTLGLMSLSLVDLEVLAKSGTPKDRASAGISLPSLLVAHHTIIGCLVDPKFEHKRKE